MFRDPGETADFSESGISDVYYKGVSHFEAQTKVDFEALGGQKPIWWGSAGGAIKSRGTVPSEKMPGVP